MLAHAFAHRSDPDPPSHFQLAATAAEFAEILRNSYWAKESSLEQVADLARQISDRLEEDPAVREFAALEATAARLWANTQD